MIFVALNGRWLEEKPFQNVDEAFDYLETVENLVGAQMVEVKHKEDLTRYNPKGFCPFPRDLTKPSSRMTE